MCDNICRSEKKYALAPVPYFPPPIATTGPYPAIEVDTPIYEPVVTPVLKNIVQETTINVPKIHYKENVVEVPKVEYRPYAVIKDVETPVYQDLYKYKDVVVPQKQYRIKPIYKEVDVPEIEYVDKYVKKKYKRFKYVPKEVQIPFRPKREIYEEVPVPRYIPQHLESVIQPDHVIGEPPLPIHDSFPGNLPNFMIAPTTPVKQSTTNKCCLSSLFCPKKKKFEGGVALAPPHVFDVETPIPGLPAPGGFYSSPPYFPHAYDAIGYSHPFLIEEEEKDFCKCLIETTSNILAASGIALILAGKLTYDGINYLVNMKGKDKPNMRNYNDHTSTNEETNPSQRVESTNQTTKSAKSYSYRSSDVTQDDVI